MTWEAIMGYVEIWWDIIMTYTALFTLRDWMELTISLGFGAYKYMEGKRDVIDIYSLNLCFSCEVTDFDNILPMEQKNH